MNASIEIKSLTIGYPRKKKVKIVANNLSARINDGELTCLIGVNGVGKSTLLRTISGFQPKLSGQILIQGKELQDYSKAELAEKISVVLTDRIDVRNMTAREIIALGRNPYTGFWGTLTSNDQQIIDEAIHRISITHLSNRMIETLSDGERQKVMIAKALVQETPIIFLDEPTAFLDFPSKVEMMQLLHRLSRETRKTIFVTTHDLELAIQLADKIWIMDKTDGLTVGVPEDLSQNGSFERFFNRKGIRYDGEKGVFKIEHSILHRIKLIGDENGFTLVQKALLRNGILADRDIDSDCWVEITKKNPSEKYVIHMPEGNQVRLNSIEELLEYFNSFSVSS